MIAYSAQHVQISRSSIPRYLTVFLKLCVGTFEVQTTRTPFFARYGGSLAFAGKRDCLSVSQVCVVLSSLYRWLFVSDDRSCMLILYECDSREDWCCVCHIALGRCEESRAYTIVAGKVDIALVVSMLCAKLIMLSAPADGHQRPWKEWDHCLRQINLLRPCRRVRSSTDTESACRSAYPALAPLEM